MRYFVYILYSGTANRYYKGQTRDLTLRLARHNAGLKKSSAPHRPWKLGWYTSKSSRTAAMKQNSTLELTPCGYPLKIIMDATTGES